MADNVAISDVPVDFTGFAGSKGVKTGWKFQSWVKTIAEVFPHEVVEPFIRMRPDSVAEWLRIYWPNVAGICIWPKRSSEEPKIYGFYVTPGIDIKMICATKSRQYYGFLDCHWYANSYPVAIPSWLYYGVWQLSNTV